MIAALVAGAAAGWGVLALGWALAPPRQDLAAAVGRLDLQRTTTSPANRVRPNLGNVDSSPATSARAHAMGQWLEGRVTARGWAMTGLRANLALMGRTLESHLVSKAVTAAIGLVLPVALAAVLTAGGVDTGLAIPVVVGVVMAAGFSVLPDISVAQAAARRRDELRRALACYLDLVSMALAGGRGAPEALPSAANIGRGWAFELIADTLTHARYSGTTPWAALKHLGERVDVAELRDLGNALGLVSDDGAKIRESLRARAATARARQLAEAEGAAERASESIKNAHLLLGFAFLLFLGFPAVAAVMAI